MPYYFETGGKRHCSPLRMVPPGALSWALLYLPRKNLSMLISAYTGATGSSATLNLEPLPLIAPVSFVPPTPLDQQPAVAGRDTSVLLFHRPFPTTQLRTRISRSRGHNSYVTIPSNPGVA